MPETAIDALVRLSRTLGTPTYVLGGGGNTSCKDAHTLWIKPSGTVLGELTSTSFVALDRARLAELYALKPPAEVHAREAFVKEKTLASVRPESRGRPSVEAPLHDSFDAPFVAHTHPALVNGMLCAQDGEDTCRELFPEALWVPNIDPGYMVSMRVREDLRAYADAHGEQPAVVFLQNHGIFVAGGTVEAVQGHYDRILSALARCYAEARVSTKLAIGEAPCAEIVNAVRARLQAVCGADATSVVACGPFPVAAGPLTPDHIVYHKAHILEADPTPEALEGYRRAHGFWPRVVSCAAGVFGLADTEKNARLALLFAQDGALVQQLAAAFGGVRFMSRQASDFVENWEVEAYRRKVAAKD